MACGKLLRVLCSVFHQTGPSADYVVGAHGLSVVSFCCVQTWLAAGSLPGGLDALDRQTYEQAVATYVVLQEAASKGLECLEQVGHVVKLTPSCIGGM